MRTKRALLMGFLAALAGAVLAAVEKHASGTKTGSPAWERLKTLQGEWEGTYEGKDPVAISYRLVSNGMGLMETMSNPAETEMVTIYHPDGERLAMTHFCSEGNQPRMRTEAQAGDSNRLVFSFVDATNLPAPEEMHMKKLVVTFGDSSHFTQEWTARAAGKDQSSVFRFAENSPKVGEPGPRLLFPLGRPGVTIRDAAKPAPPGPAVPIQR